jgi:hypothetical protein
MSKVPLVTVQEKVTKAAVPAVSENTGAAIVILEGALIVYAIVLLVLLYCGEVSYALR